MTITLKHQRLITYYFCYRMWSSFQARFNLKKPFCSHEFNAANEKAKPFLIGFRKPFFGLCSALAVALPHPANATLEHGPGQPLDLTVSPSPCSSSSVTVRSSFGFGFLRRSTAYVPIGVLTRLYRLHPCKRPDDYYMTWFVISDEL